MLIYTTKTIFEYKKTLFDIELHTKKAILKHTLSDS
jgi:hypothetical protein